MIHRYELSDVYIKNVQGDIIREKIWDYDSVYFESEAFSFNLANTLKIAIHILKKWKITPLTIVFNNLIIVYLYFGRLKIYKTKLISDILNLV